MVQKFASMQFLVAPEHVHCRKRVPSGDAGIPGRCDGLTAVMFFREQSRAENAQRTAVPRVGVIAIPRPE